VAGWSVAILGTAPLIAAFAQWLDWRVAFALLGAASWAAWAMLRRGLSRQHARAVPGAAVPASDLRASIATVAGHRRTRLLLLANLLDMGAFFSVYAYLGTQLRAANGWGPTLAGLTLACYGIGLALASLNGRLIDRVGALRSARATLLVLVVVLATLPWLADRPWLMAIGMVAWGLVQGGFFTAITALASDQLPALRGVVTALLSGSTYLGVALYAPAAGALYGSQGLWAVGLLSAAGCLLAALALRRL
jgi:predicted MFS family arabinose efflux permease